jgi:hypothetical protein
LNEASLAYNPLGLVVANVIGLLYRRDVRFQRLDKGSTIEKVDFAVMNQLLKNGQNPWGKSVNTIEDANCSLNNQQICVIELRKRRKGIADAHRERTQRAES